MQGRHLTLRSAIQLGAEDMPPGSYSDYENGKRMSARKRFPFSVFRDYWWKAEHFVGARGVKQGSEIG